jgi:hypothetical protein
MISRVSGCDFDCCATMNGISSDQKFAVPILFGKVTIYDWQTTMTQKNYAQVYWLHVSLEHFDNKIQIIKNP